MMASTMPGSLLAPVAASQSKSLFRPAGKTFRSATVSNGNAQKTTAMQVWTPLKNKFFETFSYLPALTGDQISRQVDAIIDAGTTPCLEFSDPKTAYTDSHSAKRMGDVTCNYYDNRYWTMWKLPMFGCTDPGQVLQEVDECTRAFPNAYIRLVAFDAVRQVQVTGFLVHRPESSDEHRDPRQRSVGDEGFVDVRSSAGSWGGSSNGSASRGRSAAPARPSSRPVSSRPSSAPPRPSSRPVSAPPARPAASSSRSSSPPPRPSSSPRPSSRPVTPARPSSAPIRPSSAPVRPSSRPVTPARPSSSPRPSSRVVTPARPAPSTPSYSAPTPSYSSSSYGGEASPSDLARMLVLDREVHAALKRAGVSERYHMAAWLLAPAKLRPTLLGIYQALQEALGSGSVGRQAQAVLGPALASVAKQVVSGGFSEGTVAAYKQLAGLPRELRAAGVGGDALAEFVGAWLLLAPEGRMEAESKARLVEYVKETAASGDGAALRGLAEMFVQFARDV